MAECKLVVVLMFCGHVYVGDVVFVVVDAMLLLWDVLGSKGA